MKLALSNIAWEKDEQPDVIALMEEYGVSGVEIAPTKVWDIPIDASSEQVKAEKAYWADRGIQVSSLQALLFGHPEFDLFGSDSDRASMLKYLGEIIRVAGLLGAGPLVFGSPKNRLKRQKSFSAARMIAVPFFRDVAKVAELHGTTFCLEPNPPQYGCDFVTNTEEAIEIVEAVDHSHFRLHLDSGIMTLNEEDPLTSIPKGARWLAHFHVSEPNLAVIGSGGVDHPRFAEALEGIGYEDWISVEMRGGWNDPNTISVSNALEAVRHAYLQA